MSSLSDLSDNDGPFSKNLGDNPTGFDILCAATVRKPENPNVTQDAWSPVRTVPTSFLETREQYTRDITTWAITSDADQTMPIYWVRGPAGVGKSLIAKACAEYAIEIRHPCPLFFFNPNHLDEHKRFVVALAVQLAAIFPRYRDIVDDLVYADKSLIHKNLISQFRSLIVEPLLTLQDRGDEIGIVTIFVDGIDICRNKDAQVEILQIIVASVSDPSSPFRWAIFSLPEPHIEAIFNRKDVSPLCHRVLLSVAGKPEEELERYLRTGFENILRSRGLLENNSAWPTDNDIATLLRASTNQFAYPATVLRFLEERPSPQLEGALRAILNTIVTCDQSGGPLSPTAYLDALYMFIMRRVPQAVLPSTKLFLADLALSKFCSQGWLMATHCNALGIFILEFKLIYDYLRSVLEYWEVPEPRKQVTRSYNTSRSFYDQGHKPGRSPEFMETVIETGGIIFFRDKSFFDFLCDPSRSSIFCISTPHMHERIFETFYQVHAEMAQKFNQSLGFIRAHDVSSSHPPLPCPAGNELMDSILNWDVFNHITDKLFYSSTTFPSLLEQIPQPLLEKLRNVDYRKHMEADYVFYGQGIMDSDDIIQGCPGSARRILYCTWFGCIDTQYFGTANGFDPDVFLKTVKTLENLSVIHPYHSILPSRLAFLSRLSTSNDRTGLRVCGKYRMGERKKAIFWYWEMDREQRYFHEVRSTDSAEFDRAVGMYQKDKFRIWEDSWVKPS